MMHIKISGTILNTWYDEHLKGNLDAILSNTSGCGTTMKDYGFIFKDDKKMKKESQNNFSTNKRCN